MNPTCVIDGCGSAPFGHGWCNAHYKRWQRHGDPLGGRRQPGSPKPICGVDGCDVEVYAGGQCNPHYRRTMRYGDPLAPRPKRERAEKRPCSVDDCARDQAAKGWCRLHYDRWRKSGDPLVVEYQPGRPCAVGDCARPNYGRGWCQRHYYRWKRTGDPLGSIPRKPGSPGTVRPKVACAVELCGRDAKARGWCTVHYTRWRMYGDALFEPETSNPCQAEGCDRHTRVGYCVNHRHRVNGAKNLRCVSHEYSVRPDGAAVLTMQMEDGAEYATVFDAADLELVQSYRWTITHQGYVISTSTVRLHRLLLGLTAGDGVTADHINGDRRDNRRCNLRRTTNQRNVAHQAVVNHRGTSRFRNVYRERTTGRWNAEVWVSRKKHWLGSFDTEEAAADAAAEFRVKHGLPSGY